MNIVLLSGGSGKRLWPLSNDILSKQFLKLLKNEKGQSESMVERVYRQIMQHNPTADIFVSCNTKQEEVLRKQLPDVEVILEPTRRDTFPAIVLAAAYLHFIKGLPLDEDLVVCPIDVFAHPAYFEKLGQLKANEIGLLGAVPTYPSTKYGYILNNQFVEKPTVEKAQELIDAGALWNCGVFALKIGYVLDKAKPYVSGSTYETYHAHYHRLPKVSFDYEVAEKESALSVTVYDGVWKDLGTWNTLTEEMGKDIHGKNIYLDARGTHVINMLNIPVIVKDVDNAVVIASHDGILVTTKSSSAHLKPLTEQVSNQPMYEQRVWGEYQVIDNNPKNLVKRIYMDAGGATETTCPAVQAIYTVISGKGIAIIDEKDQLLIPGDVIKIASSQTYSLIAATQMELIAIEHVT